MTSFGQWPQWQDRIQGERPSADRSRLEIWGYTGKPSYAPGDRLELHVSTTAKTFSVEIYRDGSSLELVHSQDGVEGISSETPDDAYTSGCGWSVGYALTIPEEWPSGGYVVVFRASDERGSVEQDGFFILRPSTPGLHGGIAFVVATYTWQEYNDWGGACGYSSDGAEGFSARLAFQRPWSRGLIRVPGGAPRIPIRHPPEIGWAPRYEAEEWAYANGFSIWSCNAGWARYDGLFARWAERNGYTLEYLSQWDLDREPELLDGYDCVVTAGHDEYWTATGRTALDSFIEGGGRYARLAGNIFWQVRLEDDGKTQVCYKFALDKDPLANAPDIGLRTGAFEAPSIARPPVTTFGANGARGIYGRLGGVNPRGVGGFVVYRNRHWVFADTDLYYADVLGADVPLVGYEADGVIYTFRNGLPFPTGEDGTPPALEILALTPVGLEEEDHGNPGTVLWLEADLPTVTAVIYGSDTPRNRELQSRGAAVITHMAKGAGEVFCGGTTEWPYALDRAEPMVERIVHNVLNRFGSTRLATSPDLPDEET